MALCLVGVALVVCFLVLSDEGCIDRECFDTTALDNLPYFQKQYALARANYTDWVKSPEDMARFLASGDYMYVCTDHCAARSLPADEGKAIVIVSNNFAGDDSISAVRYRVEMSRLPDGVWQVDWVGKQWQCGRGGFFPGWGTHLCV